MATFNVPCLASKWGQEWSIFVVTKVVTRGDLVPIVATVTVSVNWLSMWSSWSVLGLSSISSLRGYQISVRNCTSLQRYMLLKYARPWWPLSDLWVSSSEPTLLRVLWRILVERHRQYKSNLLTHSLSVILFPGVAAGNMSLYFAPTKGKLLSWLYIAVVQLVQ